MTISNLDARDRPPESIKSFYKRYQKLTLEAIQTDSTIIDFRLGLSSKQQSGVRKVGSVPLSSVDAAYSRLRCAEANKFLTSSVDVAIYEIEALPGEPLNLQDRRVSHSLLTNQDYLFYQLWYLREPNKNFCLSYCTEI